MIPDLPPGLSPQDLPPHRRGPWVQDFHAISPDGHHTVILYGVDEHRMGHFHGYAIWSKAQTPWAAIGGIPRLPLAQFVHWIDSSRFALKLNAFHGAPVRPMIVIDLDGTFAVLPNSSGATPDPTLLSEPITALFEPFTPQALAVAVDLIHLS